MHDAPEFTTFVVGVLALIASQELAYLVGPYAAIGVAGGAGALLAMPRDLTPRSVVSYIGVRVVAALVLTVSLAHLLTLAWPTVGVHYTLAPLAFCIGIIRDYRDVGAWLISVVNRLLPSKSRGGK